LNNPHYESRVLLEIGIALKFFIDTHLDHPLCRRLKVEVQAQVLEGHPSYTT
jgi:hypothetical protein